MSWISKFTPDCEEQLYFKVWMPALELRQVVAYYWVLKCDLETPRKSELMVPDGFEEIIFSYEDGYDRVESQDLGDAKRVNSSYVIGAKDRAVRCSRSGKLSMIGIKLLPQSIHALSGIPADGFLNQVIDLGSLENGRLRQLESELFDARNPLECIDLLNEACRGLFLDKCYDPLVDRAVRQICRMRGCEKVKAVVDTLGCHYRTLERRFKKQIGMSPKGFARNIRFKHAFFAINRQQSHSLIQYYDFGYYDIAHYSKEFKAFTGFNPGEYFDQRKALSTSVFEISHDAEKREARNFG